MALLLHRQPGTGQMKECWASLSSSPSLSLSLIDMWNSGHSLSKGDRGKARERDREREKRPRSPSGTLEGYWALSGQSPDTNRSFSVCFCDPVCSLLLSDSPHCSFIFVSIFLSFLPSVLTCQSICFFLFCFFVLLSVFWWCLSLLLFFSPLHFFLFCPFCTLYTQDVISTRFSKSFPTSAHYASGPLIRDVRNI